MSVNWIIRAKQSITALDWNGNPSVLELGQRGWIDSDEALRLAQMDVVEILSPDGVDALAAVHSSSMGVPTDGLQTEAKQESGADTSDAQSQTAAPAVAASHHRGPQLKPLRS
jgi:hypothetical protein